MCAVVGCASGRSPAEGQRAAPAAKSDTSLGTSPNISADAAQAPPSPEVGVPAPASSAADERSDTPSKQPRARTALAVTVTWLDPPAFVYRSPGLSACAHERPAPMTVHALGGVAGVAVVVRAVEGTAAEVAEGASAAATEADGDADVGPGAAVELAATVAIRRCVAEPRLTALAHPTARVRVLNQDERRHTVFLGQLDPATGELDRAQRVEVSLPIVGSEVALTLPGSGRYRLDIASARGGRRDRGAAAADDSAYVIAAADGEQIAITDERGRARFRDLAPGRYEVTVWHPPVEPGQAPLVRRQLVTIEPGARARAKFSLESSESP
ncbi:MAG: hypothetical protein Tsb0020_36230 [Haliangiales bacterium]